MKNTTIIFLFLVLLAGCGAPDKKARLEQLRTEKSKIEDEIAMLEKELVSSDSASGKVTEVIATPLEPQVFKTYIEVQGRVEAEENVSLSTQLPGTITKIHVQPGDKVQAGQVLAETDARAVQQQLAAMQTSMSLVSQMYEKQKNLWDQKIGTEMQYLQAKTMKEGLEAALAGLQEQLRMTKIISPIAGTVDKVDIKVGQAVAPGVPAISVINFNDLKVEANVAESYAARVKSGNEVQVLFPDMNDSITAKVSHVTRAIDPLTRTFRVEVPLDSKKEYHPNMVARLRINDYKSKDPVLVVPVKYIQRGTNESFVFVAENNKVVKRQVNIRREYSGLAEIANGLKPGDLLITDGYDLVNEGEKVVLARQAS